MKIKNIYIPGVEIGKAGVAGFDIPSR